MRPWAGWWAPPSRCATAGSRLSRPGASSWPASCFISGRTSRGLVCSSACSNPDSGLEPLDPPAGWTSLGGVHFSRRVVVSRSPHPVLATDLHPGAALLDRSSGPPDLGLHVSALPL